MSVLRRLQRWLENKRRYTFITPMGDVHVYSTRALTHRECQMMLRAAQNGAGRLATGDVAVWQ